MKTLPREASTRTVTAEVTQMMSLLGEHDAGTLRHCLRVSQLAGAMAGALGAPPASCRAAGLAGLLHDVGKLTVPTRLITKPGPLSASEARVMGGHALNGARMIRSFAAPEIVHVVARHHDRLDECPGLPWLTRLVSVADTYDALVFDRPYRPAASFGAAAVELRRAAGTQLDEDMVELLLGTVDAGRLVGSGSPGR